MKYTLDQLITVFAGNLNIREGRETRRQNLPHCKQPSEILVKSVYFCNCQSVLWPTLFVKKYHIFLVQPLIEIISKTKWTPKIVLVNRGNKFDAMLWFISFDERFAFVVKQQWLLQCEIILLSLNFVYSLSPSSHRENCIIMDQNVSVIVAYLFACTETECAGPQPSFSTDALDWEPRDKTKDNNRSRNAKSYENCKPFLDESGFAKIA